MLQEIVCRAYKCNFHRVVNYWPTLHLDSIQWIPRYTVHTMSDQHLDVIIISTTQHDNAIKYTPDGTKNETNAKVRTNKLM